MSAAQTALLRERAGATITIARLFSNNSVHGRSYRQASLRRSTGIRYGGAACACASLRGRAVTRRVLLSLVLRGLNPYPWLVPYPCFTSFPAPWITNP